MDDQTLPWRPLAPFGAEVLADLSMPLDPAQARALRDLVWSHGLVLARGQALSMVRQRELCALLGPILLRQGEDGTMTNETGHAASVSPLSWHADAAYTDAPFDALSLHALDVVDDASSTRFVDAGAALARLPADLRERLALARVEMVSPGLDMLAGRVCDLDDPHVLKRGERPGIHTNPHNGRDVVWVSELQAARVLGLAREDSRALLHAVFAQLYRKEHVLEHTWRTGDLIIWDNIALQHARGSLVSCGRRVLQRVIVGTAGVIPTIPEPA